MIVKFKTKQGWEFIDKVDNVQTIIEKNPEGKDTTTRVIIWKNKDGIKIVDSNIELKHDVYAMYLLNNEGKTIERIN